MARWRMRATTVAMIGLIATSVPMSPAAAQESEEEYAGANRRPILILVDTSSSMSDTDGQGKVRIDGAKEALTLLVERLAPSSSLGIWTYPGSNCSPGHLATNGYQPAASINIDTVSDQLAPDGNTPTAAALRAAAENLSLAGGRTIVLISDGESNCGGGACAAAEQLAADGFDIRFDTVGFQISATGREELECIAAATGGTYRDVDDSEELIDALEDVTVPTLGLSIAEPVEVTADAALGFPRSTWRVTATVTATGEVDARDVTVGIRFVGDRRLALFDAARLIPEVAAGQRHTVTWEFSVPVDCGYTVPFEVVARAKRAATVVESGELDIPGGDSLACLITDPHTAITIIGDSYSAGEGAPPYDKDTDNKKAFAFWNECRRGQTYGREEAGDRLSIVACSGAIIHDLLVSHADFGDPNNKSEALPAQLKQLTSVLDERSGQQIVFLSISGNDIWFSDVAKAGVWLSLSHFESFNQAISFSSRSIVEVEEPMLRALRIIESTVNHDRDVPVQFVILPYVQVVPGQDFPDEPGACKVGFTQVGQELDRDEAIKFEGLHKALNKTIESVASKLRSEGRPVHYASTIVDTLDGHTICDEEPWAHSVEPFDHESLHPNNAGYIAVWSDLIKEAGGWSVLERSLNVPESVAPEGSLCSAEEVDEAREVVITEEGSIQVTHGECIWVVGMVDLGAELESGSQGTPRSTFEILPNETAVDIVMQSTPQLVGRAIISETGEFRELVWIPDDIAGTGHTLTATIAVADGVIEIGHRNIEVIDRATEPSRIALWFFGGLALLGLGLVLVFRSRASGGAARSHDSEPTLDPSSPPARRF
jgi:lysophospholipase L1-like esterase